MLFAMSRIHFLLHMYVHIFWYEIRSELTLYTTKHYYSCFQSVLLANQITGIENENEICVHVNIC